MIVFLVNKAILPVMTDYLHHIKWYLRERFKVVSEIIAYTHVPAIPAQCKILIFVQRINPDIMKRLTEPKKSPTPQPAPDRSHAQLTSFTVSKKTPPPKKAPPPPPPSPGQYKVFLLNTEQATMSAYIARTVSDVKRYNVNVIDYSLENISLLRRKLPNTKFIHMPFPFRPKAVTPKTNGVVGLVSSPYRRQVAAAAKVPVANFQGKWGEARDQLIKKSRILLNIHFRPGDYGIFESIRCYHALEMRTLVISEPSVNSGLVLLKDYIIFCGKAGLEAKVKDVLNNYQKYYDQCFSEERVAEIEKKFESVYHKAIEELTGNSAPVDSIPVLN